MDYSERSTIEKFHRFPLMCRHFFII